MNIEKSSFSRVMFTVCRLVRVEKIVRRKVFSNSRVDNTFCLLYTSDAADE